MIKINSFDEHLELVKQVSEMYDTAIGALATRIASLMSDGSTLFWCGNGGSAADCQHLAAEFVGRYKTDRKPLRSIALTTDTSVLTCIANDYSFEDIFSRQLHGLAKKNDILIAISTSGNSKNIIRALQAASSIDIHSFALLGNEGGLANSLAGSSIVIPSNNTARIQECHILICHILCELIEKELNLV